MNAATVQNHHPVFLLRLPLADYQLLLDLLREHESDPRFKSLLLSVVSLVTLVEDTER